MLQYLHTKRELRYWNTDKTTNMISLYVRNEHKTRTDTGEDDH